MVSKITWTKRAWRTLAATRRRRLAMARFLWIAMRRGRAARSERQRGAECDEAAVVVDGGPNPRKSGAGPKTGTELAVEPLVARLLAGRPLSMPKPPLGGGRRPAFTGAYQPATIGPEVGGWMHLWQPSSFAIAVYARIYAATNSCISYCSPCPPPTPERVRDRGVLSPVAHLPRPGNSDQLTGTCHLVRWILANRKFFRRTGQGSLAVSWEGSRL